MSPDGRQPSTRSAGRPHIHLINSLEGLGGSELRTIDLHRELGKEADVELWSEQAPGVAFAELPIRQLDAARGWFPRDGTLLFVGVYFTPVGPWIRYVAANRVIIIYNTFAVTKLAGLVNQLRAAGLPTPEIVYTSNLVRKTVERPEGFAVAPPPDLLEACAAVRSGIAPRSVVHPSPIPVDRFLAIPRRERQPGEPLVVGRHSRDTPEKFHSDDPALFCRLAEQGMRVRLMGATCLAGEIGSTPGIEILPVGAESAADFLASLDVFLYRVSLEGWLEALGRVILEAMAAGLPCVCEKRGGHVELIEQGSNGLLFHPARSADAIAIVEYLRDHPAVGPAVGAAARQTIRDLYSPARRRETLSFYLGR
jgi:glycosyltransferase involved in cell wall biosynthesis